MQYNLLLEIPLVFKITRIQLTGKNLEEENFGCIIYEVKNGNYQFLESTKEIKKTQPAVIIYGSIIQKENDEKHFQNWKKKFFMYHPIDLILAYAAAHRQYPDQTNDIIIHDANCEIFEYYQIKSKEWGCSLENPSLFFLVHMFADRLNEIE